MLFRSVPTLQLCPMGENIFDEFKRLTRKYGKGKKNLRVEWEESAPGVRLPEYSGDSEKKAVYVALPIPVLEKFVKYLRMDGKEKVK